MKGFLRLLKFLAALALLALAGVFVVERDARGVLEQPLNISERTAYEIPLGGSLRTITADLRARGIVRNARLPLYLDAYARITGLTGALKAGEYELEPGMSGLDVLRLFVSGKIVLHDLKLIEGWNFDQALKAIADSPELAHTIGADGVEALMQQLGRAGMYPEGRFFPDTYHFPKGTSDVAFLRRSAAAMDNVLAAEWEARDPDLPYRNQDEALIMASIVEKETGVVDERPLVASVFINRLRIGMKLQTDPTVIYGLGKSFDGNLRRVDLTTDTPYNSYTRAGLPPTPICLPGRASIHAALHPASAKYLFFVSRGDGTHVFSETLEQHNAAVNKFQKKPHEKPQEKKPEPAAAKPAQGKKKAGKKKS